MYNRKSIELDRDSPHGIHYYDCYESFEAYFDCFMAYTVHISYEMYVLHDVEYHMETATNMDDYYYQGCPQYK